MTRRRWLLLLVLLGLPGFTVASPTYSGKVVGVSDGDTITVLIAGKGTKVRLHGVDCPEKTQAFGSKAKEYTSKLVFGKVVTVRYLNTDRYGRWVGEIYFDSEYSLNEVLVRDGFAWWYHQYAPTAAGLQRLELEAREARKGLWSDLNPVAPWSFRRAGRGKMKACVDELLGRVA